MVKNPSAKAGDLRNWFNPVVGKILWRRGNPLQYSCLENPHGQSRLGSIGLQRAGQDRSDLAHKAPPLPEGCPHSLQGSWEVGASMGGSQI